MGEKVQFSIFANAKDAEKALVSLEKKYDQLKKKIQQTSRASKKGADDSTKSLKKQGLSIVKAALLYGGITAAIRLAFITQEQLRKSAEATAIAIEKTAKALQIQAGLTNLQSKNAQSRVDIIAKEAGVSQQSVNRIATEFASQGFGPGLNNGLVRSTIAFLQSSNVPVDEAPLEELIKAVSQELRAGGKKLTAKNSLDLFLRIRGLFKETPFQTPQLLDFSKIRGVARKSGVDEETFLSAATVLSEQLPSTEGATGLRNVILRLAAPESSAKKALEAAGLDPKAIDLVGETLPEALKRLGKVVDALPEEERQPFLKKIFGQKAIAPAGFLIEGAQAGKFEEFAKLQQDREGFEAGVIAARSGIAASVAKLKAAEAEAKIKLATSGQATETEIESVFNARRTNALRNAPALARPFVSIGQGIESLGAMIFGKRAFVALQDLAAPHDSGEIISETRKSTFQLEKLQESLDKNTTALERNNKQPPNRNANGE